MMIGIDMTFIRKNEINKGFFRKEYRYTVNKFLEDSKRLENPNNSFCWYLKIKRKLLDRYSRIIQFE